MISELNLVNITIKVISNSISSIEHNQKKKSAVNILTLENIADYNYKPGGRPFLNLVLLRLTKKYLNIRAKHLKTQTYESESPEKHD